MSIVDKTSITTERSSDLARHLQLAGVTIQGIDGRLRAEDVLPMRAMCDARREWGIGSVSGGFRVEP
jgi:hypothetical protein